MKIRKAEPDDLDMLIKMFENARRFMAGHGNAGQWGGGYPSRELIERDVGLGQSYVCERTAACWPPLCCWREKSRPMP